MANLFNYVTKWNNEICRYSKILEYTIRLEMIYDAKNYKISLYLEHAEKFDEYDMNIMECLF